MENLSATRFAYHRLHLPCIVLPVTEVRWQCGPAQETLCMYEAKVDGLHGLLIDTHTTEVRACPSIGQTSLRAGRVCRQWGLGKDLSEPESPLHHSLGGYPVEEELADRSVQIC
jgi:hypothetical protein